MRVIALGLALMAGSFTAGLLVRQTIDREVMDSRQAEVARMRQNTSELLAADANLKAADEELKKQAARLEDANEVLMASDRHLKAACGLR